MKRAQIPAVKEPVALMRQDGKRPDGTTILPWSRGRPLAWDVAVPDTYADAPVVNTAREAGAAANHAATMQQEHQLQPAIQHSCVPSGGHWDRGYMAPSGGGTGTGDWKTDSQHYRRCQGVQLPVPAAVRGTTEGECGLISKHVHRQLARCNPLFQIIIIIIIKADELTPTTADQRNNSTNLHVQLKRNLCIFVKQKVFNLSILYCDGF